MPVQWTSEADAKLFVGVLNQCHGQLKLDSQRLAQHMGGDCTACAIEQRIAKLKRHAKALGSNSTDTTPITTPAKKNGAATTTADAETPTKPKRKAGTGGRDHANGEGAAVPKKAAKKAKVKVEVQEEGVGEEGFGFFKLEKKDLGGVKKEEEEEEEEDGAMA